MYVRRLFDGVKNEHQENFGVCLDWRRYDVRLSLRCYSYFSEVTPLAKVVADFDVQK